jgi:peptidoglycan biosynthesis protein MviN/MurJ (putative lipid II flippase)
MILQAFSLGALTTTQLALSFLLQVVVISLVGAGEQTDAWVAAQAVPMVIIAIASVAFQGAWQAELTVTSTNPEEFLARQRRAHGQLLILMGALILLLAATASLWTRLLFPGFDSDQQTLTARIAVILLAGTLLNAHAVLFTIALRAQHRFQFPEAITAVGGLLAIGITLLGIHKIGIVAAAVGSLARSIFIAAILFVSSGRALPAISAGWRDIDAWRRIRPLLYGLTISKAGPLVDRFFGALVPAGGLTILNLSLTGMNALSAVMERALCTVPITSLSRLAQQRDYDGMRRIYRQCLKSTALAAGAVLLVLLALLPVWAYLARHTLGFTEPVAMQMWWLCILLVAYLAPASSGTALTFSFYALADTTTPARVGTIGFLVSIVLKAVGFYLFGLYGVVISLVVHYLGNIAVLCWLLERRLRYDSERPTPSVP